MKGLILKDFYNMAKSFKFFLLIILIYGGISYFNGSGAFLTFMIILISMMVPITALSTDEKDQWDVLGLTMPVTPLTMVGEKFLLVLACCVIGLGGGLAVSLLFTVTGGKVSISEIWATLIPGSCVVLLYNCILLPVVYKFGSERGRIISIVVVMAPALVMMILEKQEMLPELPVVLSWLKNTGGLIILIAVPVLFLISFFLSLHLYRAKEW